MNSIQRIVIAVLAVISMGCSPQKRLAVLLAKHPELQHDSSWVISKDIIVPADSASVEFSIAQLRDIAPETDSLEQSRTRNNGLTVATMSGATATICATTQTDRYRLKVKTNTDTIHIRDTITVPAYTTRVAYKDKIVYQMNNAQSFFFWLGIIVMIVIVLAVVLRIVIRFIKV